MGHEVWTLEDVKAVLPSQDTFWLSACACRVDAGSKCGKGLRVCLGFSPEATSTPDRRGAVGRKEVDDLLRFSGSEQLVPRPWVNEEGKVTAVCFCCPCCCAYILGKEPNVAGPKKESTDRQACQDCGACESVCYFGARTLSDGKLKVAPERCFGCGLCVSVCPTAAVGMVPR